MLLVMRMLGVELHLQERRLLRVGPVGDAQLFQTRRGIEAREKRQISVGNGAECQTGLRGTRRAKGNDVSVVASHAGHPRLRSSRG